MKNYGMCLPFLLVLILIFAPLSCFSLESTGSMEITGGGTNPDAVGMENEISAAEEGETAIETTAVSDTDYLRIAGCVLRPRQNDVSWSIGSSGGCLYVTSGDVSTIFNVPVMLPPGSIISYFRMYYNDTNASLNSTAWLTVYDLYGAIVEEWPVNSAGSVGNGYSTSALIEHTVEYNSYSYVINWRPNDSGEDMQVCGFRLFYTPPEIPNKAVFFPVISNP
jgi:hypothetical protein